MELEAAQVVVAEQDQIHIQATNKQVKVHREVQDHPMATMVNTNYPQYRTDQQQGVQGHYKADMEQTQGEVQLMEAIQEQG